MKRTQKNHKGERTLPLIWQDTSWTLRVNVRVQLVCAQRRGAMPFTPFRGFQFPQPSI